MNEKELLKSILKENIAELEYVELTDELHLITSGYVDSFDLISIIAIIEEKFNIQLDFEALDMERFNSVNQIYEIIMEAKKQC